MVQTRGQTKITIIEVGRDDGGCYAKVCVHATDGDLVIRWGLDELTFRHIENTVLVFRNFHNHELLNTPLSLHAFSFVGGDSTYKCELLIVANGQTIRQEFSCSALFISNLEWLKKVNSIHQVSPLRWDAYADGDAPAADDFPANHSSVAPAPNKRKLRKYIGTAVSGLALACLFYGLLQFHVVDVKALGIAFNDMENSDSMPARIAKLFGTGARPGDQALPTVNGVGPTGPQGNAVNSQQTGNQTVSPPADKVQPPAEQPVRTGPAHEHYLTTGSVPEIFGVAAGQVALTFDDGPSPYTDQILKVLKSYHVKVTFFFIGNRLKLWPHAVQNALADGHVVGSHSLDHPFLPHLGQDAQATEILRANMELAKYDPQPITLFRPPYGAYNGITLGLLHQQHLALAMWNRDPRDWAAKTPQQIVGGVIHGQPSGAVFDLHENQLTVEALPAIIEALRAQGLEFVTLVAPASNAVAPSSSGTGNTAGNTENSANALNSANEDGASQNMDGSHS